MQTTDMTVLITGGGAGIGLALARAFKEAGNSVVICGRDPDTLAQASADVPGLEVAQCDIASDESVNALAGAYSERVSVLVNNASILRPTQLPSPNLSFAEQIEEVNINLVGTLRMLHAFLPALQKRPQAAIVNVTSASVFVPSADEPIYCATKAAVHSLTRSLRHQLRESSVKVFELIPPLTDTQMASDVQRIPKLAPETVARALLQGMAKDRHEITPGLSRAAKWMSRVAPSLGFNLLNRERKPAQRDRT